MKPKRLSIKTFTFNTVGEKVSEPTTATTDIVTCVKCKQQFSDEEWETIEKENGWQALPTKPAFESFKITCVNCNQLNLFTRRKK